MSINQCRKVTEDIYSNNVWCSLYEFLLYLMISISWLLIRLLPYLSRVQCCSFFSLHLMVLVSSFVTDLVFRNTTYNYVIIVVVVVVIGWDCTVQKSISCNYVYTPIRFYFLSFLIILSILYCLFCYCSCSCNIPRLLWQIICPNKQPGIFVVFHATGLGTVQDSFKSCISLMCWYKTFPSVSYIII